MFLSLIFLSFLDDILDIKPFDKSESKCSMIYFPLLNPIIVMFSKNNFELA